MTSYYEEDQSTGWTLVEEGAQDFKIWNPNTGEVYEIESSLIHSGISLNADEAHFYVRVNEGQHWDNYGDTQEEALSRIRGNTIEQPGPMSWWDPDGDVRETTGSESDLLGYGSGWFGYENHVKQIVDDYDRWVANVTTDDHVLDEGMVVRIPRINAEGNVEIVTVGWGNGDLETANKILAIPLWWVNSTGIFGETKWEYEQDKENVKLKDFRSGAPGDDIDGATTDTYADDVEVKVGDGKESGSPLVLDIDGDGIELVSLSSVDAVYWDVDVDGFAEASGWVGSDDGLLAIDLDQDGRIDNSGELFGDQTGYANGFLALAAYDSNSDSLINAQDNVFDDLLVWIDENGDGFSQADELHTMDDLLITEIDLGYSDTSSTIAGNDILQESTFTIDGNTRDIADAYFAYDNVNTVYDQETEYDLTAFALPLLRGYGNLPDLHISNSLDNDDEDLDSLISLVTDLNDLFFANIFTDDSTIMDDVADIMYRWAEVDDVATDSRGPNVDARQLEFLEKMMGQPFEQTASAGQSDPALFAGLALQEAFDIAQQNIYARLVVQSAGADLFEGDWYYDTASDALVGVTGLNQSTIDTLETQGLGETNPDVFWANVVRVIENTVGVSNLSGGDQTYLDDAIYATDNSLTLSGIVDSLDWDAPSGTTYNGDGSANTLTGGTGNDTLNGNGGDDTLEGGIGDDDLLGGADDDILKGQSGQDYMRGGAGDDEYQWDAGHGHDVIREEQTGAGHSDKIVLGSGFDSGDLTFTRIGNTGLQIDIDNGSQTGQIIIENQFNYAAGGGHVEEIEFYDTSTYDLDGQSWTTYGTAGDDTIRGVYDGKGGNGDDTIYGGAGDDTIYANAPNETDTLANTLYGEAGDDVLNGSNGADTLYGGNDDDELDGGAGADVLDGGAGDDDLTGGTGDDTFYYVSGHDVMFDNSGTETLYLDAVWDSVTPQYFRIGNDMQIWFDVDNTITITSFFTGSQIETMEYDDTTSVDLTSVSTITQGTESGESLAGTSGNDVLFGNGGDDTLNGAGGSTGDDMLYGGTGDDDLRGGYGDDFMDGGAGDDEYRGGFDDDTFYYSGGNDYMDEQSGSADVLQFAPGWTLEDLTFKRYDTAQNDLWIEIDASNSIELDNHFTSAGKWEILRIDGESDIDLDAMVFATYGTESGETMNGITLGGSLNDIMYGLGGNDTLNSGTGDDTSYGGEGNDILYGYSGDDTLYGGAGDDDLRGGADDDTLVYSEGMDTFEDIHGGNDTLWITGGYTINDMTIADSGSDDATIVITASVDEVIVENIRNGNANYHIETLTFDDGFSTDLTDYANWNWGTASGDILTGSGSDETFIGLDGDDDIDGAGGADAIHGGDGDDTIEGGTGDDVIYGGDGSDTASYSGDGAGVTVDLDAGTATDGNTDSDTLVSIENVIGSDYADTIDGDDSANVLDGGAGVDTINGADGDDTIDGGTGADDIDGGDGNDTLIGGTGNDTLDGEGGSRDRVSYANDAAAVTVNLGTGSATDGNTDTDTLSNIEDVIGSAYNDTIDGSDGYNILDGGAGNDDIDGGDGNDVLIGGTGDDTLDGEDGSDTVSYADDAAGVTVNLGTGSATDSNSDTDTLSNIENVTGSIYNDTITGDSSSNYLNGSIGNDTLSGADGADYLLGQAGTDTLNGGDGDDVLYGGDDADTLNGDGDDDYLYGGSGGDTLSGDGGNDVLYGQDGLDTLYGDAGDDTFVFLADYAFNDTDVIKDFDITGDADVIDIVDLLGAYDPMTDAITDFVQITDDSTDSTLKVDVDGGADNFVTVATLEGVTGLTDEAALVTSGNLLAA